MNVRLGGGMREIKWKREEVRSPDSERGVQMGVEEGGVGGVTN